MIDWLGVNQRVEQFHLRHGGQSFLLDGWHWYPDGAHREVDPLGALVEPPDPNSMAYERNRDHGEFDLLQCKLRYHQAALNNATREFDELQEKLFYWRPNDEKTALQKLERLKAVVEARQKEFRKAQAALDASPIGQVRKHAQNRAAEEKATLTEWHQKLKTIRV